MTKPKPDLTNPHAIGMEFFRRLGGMDEMVKWGKHKRTLAYQLIAKLMAQPVVQNNVNVANIKVDGEAARQKLETELVRMIEARKAAVGDPAVYVNGVRLDPVEQQLAADVERQSSSLTIEHQPSTADPRPVTPDPTPPPPAAAPNNAPQQVLT